MLRHLLKVKGFVDINHRNNLAHLHEVRESSSPSTWKSALKVLEPRGQRKQIPEIARRFPCRENDLPPHQGEGHATGEGDVVELRWRWQDLAGLSLSRDVPF